MLTLTLGRIEINIFLSNDLKLMEHDLPYKIFLSVFKFSMFMKSEFYRKSFPHQLKKIRCVKSCLCPQNPPSIIQPPPPAYPITSCTPASKQAGRLKSVIFTMYFKFSLLMDVLVSASGGENFRLAETSTHNVIHPGLSKLTSLKNSTDQKCHLARWKYRRSKYV